MGDDELTGCADDQSLVGRAVFDLRQCIRREALVEAADMLILKPSDIRLACGEMTASEMRSVQAVLRWRSQQIMNKANES